MAVPGYEQARTHFGTGPDHRPLSWHAIIGCPCIMYISLQLNCTTSPALYGGLPWVYPLFGWPGWKHCTSEHVGNGWDHSPDGWQTDSEGPFKPWPGGQEKAARPPTSLLIMATRGAVPFPDGGIETSPHSTPRDEFIIIGIEIDIYYPLSQIGIDELQLPLARQTISGVPIKALPLLQENWTFDPIWVAVVLKANPRRGVISPQWTAFTSTTTAWACLAGVMQE